MRWDDVIFQGVVKVWHCVAERAGGQNTEKKCDVIPERGEGAWTPSTLYTSLEGLDYSITLPFVSDLITYLRSLACLQSCK